MPRLSRAANRKLVVLVGLSSVLLVLFVTRLDVASFWAHHDSIAAVLASTSSGMATTIASAVDLGWYAPAQTLINNLTHVVSGSTTGVYGFIYNSSVTPDDEYGTYNWCNMPHVRKTEYVVPDEAYELVYVELMHRHHKRTPYAANAFPTESYPWDCAADEGLYYFARPFSDASSARPDAGRNASAQAYWRGTSDVAGFTNPFALTAAGWHGSCQFPQITAPGLDDSWQHGADLYGAYGDLLGFLPARDAVVDDANGGQAAWRAAVRYRVTNNVITSEVAGMVAGGMWGPAATTGAGAGTSVPLLVQPDGVDGLEPSYSCASAAARFANVTSPSADAAWAAHLAAAAPLYAALDRLSGVSPDDEGFHASLDHYYDNLSARQCHGKPLPCRLVNSTTGSGPPLLVNDTSDCVTPAQADEAYRLGHWEYSHTYRGAGPAALAASAASLGVWVGELAAHLRAAVGNNMGAVRWFHNVAHDGSVSRLLGVLQADVMVWPGMGSEVVFELWRRKGDGGSERGMSASGHYVRVLFGGRVLDSSNPSLGRLDMLPVETLLAYFDGLVGVNASLVVDNCNAS